MNIDSIDPRTGHVVATVAQETTRVEVDRLCRRAASAATSLEDLGRTRRAMLLRASANALSSRRQDIVAVADRETALGTDRLNGELTRSCYQLLFFAAALEEGSYLEAIIDHAGDSPAGRRPDIRRMLVPIGPVAVFGASNFPLAFSVPGGDTASALAAGCPVVVKVHESHPATSHLCFETIDQALRDAGAPDGTLSLVHGRDAATALVAHPAVKAVGFTGSLRAGRALISIINNRPDPIPFYGELSSLNPVIVTRAAASERAEDVGRGLTTSFTLGAGQFCTKPGLIFVPHGLDGDQLVATISAEVAKIGPYWLLNEHIAKSYAESTVRLSSQPGAKVAAEGQTARGIGFEAVPMLLTIEASSLTRDLVEECFGPVSVVARYKDDEELHAALNKLPSSLTATIHTGREGDALSANMMATLKAGAGRLVFNGYPTGVAVSWAQHHGGPWPSTNSSHTSVGATAIRRFLRPVAWQSSPETLLPNELRDGCQTIPRRVDGVLFAPSTDVHGTHENGNSIRAANDEDSLRGPSDQT